MRAARELANQRCQYRRLAISVVEQPRLKEGAANVQRLDVIMVCLVPLPPARNPPRLTDQYCGWVMGFQEVPSLKASGFSEITQ